MKITGNQRLDELSFDAKSITSLTLWRRDEEFSEEEVKILGQMTSLTRLDLYYCTRLKGEIDAKLLFPSLVYFHAFRCRCLTDAFVQALNPKNVKTVRLQMCPRLHSWCLNDFVAISQLKLTGCMRFDTLVFAKKPLLTTVTLNTCKWFIPDKKTMSTIKEFHGFRLPHSDFLGLRAQLDVFTNN
jgi:hypothetical protein